MRQFVCVFQRLAVCVPFILALVKTTRARVHKCPNKATTGNNYIMTKFNLNKEVLCDFRLGHGRASWVQMKINEVGEEDRDRAIFR